jgi:putative membrane protein
MTQVIDAWYGVLAALILIIGFSRAIFAAKGWEYYAHNAFFWARIGTFVVIGSPCRFFDARVGSSTSQ